MADFIWFLRSVTAKIGVRIAPLHRPGLLDRTIEFSVLPVEKSAANFGWQTIGKQSTGARPSRRGALGSIDLFIEEITGKQLANGSIYLGRPEAEIIFMADED